MYLLENWRFRTNRLRRLHVHTPLLLPAPCSSRYVLIVGICIADYTPSKSTVLSLNRDTADHDKNFQHQVTPSPLKYRCVRTSPRSDYKDRISTPRRRHEQISNTASSRKVLTARICQADAFALPKPARSHGTLFTTCPIPHEIAWVPTTRCCRKQETRD